MAVGKIVSKILRKAMFKKPKSTPKPKPKPKSKSKAKPRRLWPAIEQAKVELEKQKYQKRATPKPKSTPKPKDKPRLQYQKRQDFDDSNFPKVEYNLKSRGMTSAQKRQLRRKMGLSDDSPKAEKPVAEKPKAKKPKAKKPDAAAKQFMRNKPATGMGTDKRKPKSKIMKLQQKYEGLMPAHKRAERAKGEQSIYYPVFKKLGMGKVGSITKKKHGGMTHVGLSPAEEARAGTMPKDKRTRYMQGGGPIHTTFPKRAAPRTEGRETAIDLFPKVERAKGGKVGNKKSRGKRISSKQTDGNKLVASLYD
tara:strand:- start:494 stop:1417 length:924 start_codon:yes stop_codon:yes gene_type:complete